MSEETPDRLKNFREQYSPPPGNGGGGRGLVPLLIITVAGFAVVIGLMLFRGSAAPGAPAVTDAELHRRYGSYLAERHLYDPAIEAYARYLDEAAVDPDTRHNVSFRVAELAMENDDYETALAY